MIFLKCFSKFSLNLPGKCPQHKLYLYAGYVALMALFCNHSPVFVGEITSIFKDEGVFKQAKSDSDQAEENDSNESCIQSKFNIEANISTFILVFVQCAHGKDWNKN